MTLYRKKIPLVVEAVRWTRNGDHPEDACGTFTTRDGRIFRAEGKVVRYYRHPEVPGFHACKTCGFIMHDHGWIDAPNGGHVVCPGDWIVTGVDNTGGYIPYSPKLFKATYEPFAAQEDVREKE